MSDFSETDFDLELEFLIYCDLTEAAIGVNDFDTENILFEEFSSYFSETDIDWETEFFINGVFTEAAVGVNDFEAVKI